MKLSILLRTSEFRGDHAADIVRAFEHDPDETVEALVKRILVFEGDVVEIRLVHPAPGSEVSR